jgi:hypothetical protein
MTPWVPQSIYNWLQSFRVRCLAVLYIAFRGPFCLLPPSLLKTLLKDSHRSNSGSYASRFEVILWVLLKIQVLVNMALCHCASTWRCFEESERLSLSESLTLNYGTTVLSNCQEIPNQRHSLNHLTPNGHFSGRTAPLTYMCCILYIYSTNIRTEYFKHAAHSPFYPLQNVVYFIMLLFLVLYYSHFIYRVC